MIEILTSVVTMVKDTGPRLYTVAFAVAAAVLFVPGDLLQHVGLVEFRDTYRMFLGITLIVSGSLLLVHIVIALWKAMMRPFAHRRFIKGVRYQLSLLTLDEKDFLRPYIWGGENSNYAQFSDGVANGLAAKNIVYRASNMSVPGSLAAFPYNLQPYARAELIKHPHWLD